MTYLAVDHLIIASLGYTILRELYFFWTVNKLVNKLMSRNYHEYESAQHIYKPQKAQTNGLTEDFSDREDLGSLQEFTQ